MNEQFSLVKNKWPIYTSAVSAPMRLMQLVTGDTPLPVSPSVIFSHFPLN